MRNGYDIVNLFIIAMAIIMISIPTVLSVLLIAVLIKILFGL